MSPWNGSFTTARWTIHRHPRFIIQLMLCRYCLRVLHTSISILIVRTSLVCKLGKTMRTSYVKPFQWEPTALSSDEPAQPDHEVPVALQVGHAPIAHLRGKYKAGRALQLKGLIQGLDKCFKVIEYHEKPISESKTLPLIGPWWTYEPVPKHSSAKQHLAQSPETNSTQTKSLGHRRARNPFLWLCHEGFGIAQRFALPFCISCWSKSIWEEIINMLFHPNYLTCRLVSESSPKHTSRNSMNQKTKRGIAVVYWIFLYNSQLLAYFTFAAMMKQCFKQVLWDISRKGDTSGICWS